MIIFDLLSVNPLAIVTVIIVNTVVGMIWYSPFLFGTLWMHELNIDPNSLKMSASEIIGAAVVASINALCIGYLNKALAVTTYTAAIEYAFIYWLGFILTSQLSLVIWAGKTFTLWLIDTGCWLVNVSVTACIMLLFS